MNIKELVKQYFNLQEKQEFEAVAFGEIKDVNGAFTLLFEGETLEVGAAVKVRTAEGQELDAPDGYHNLEGGITIKTEGGIITEIERAEELVEQVTPPAIEETNETTEKKVELQEEKDTLTFPEIAQVVAEIIKKEMEFVKKEMAELKKGMEKMSAEPAEKKTIPTKKNFSLDTVNTDVVDTRRYEMMKEIIKTKKNK